jgi:zinc transporter 11
MLQGYSPITQALLGTLFTWGVTALGAATAILLKGNQRKFMDISLGFAAGVMLAASYWSLLEPALEMAAGLETYGENGEWAFLPVSLGFFLGAAFVYLADLVMSSTGVTSPLDIIDKKLETDSESPLPQLEQQFHLNGEPGLRLRRGFEVGSEVYSIGELEREEEIKKKDSWRRIVLLIVAVTVHNIPEGLAVGVGFGAIGRTKSATFESARNLALGIGMQNFPEGIAVSLPLKAAGFSTAKSIWYGQLSGLVEPIAGVLGAALVSIIVPLLPYALAFAAGAMVYVVVDDIIPEAQSEGNGKAASWGAIVGFIVMMSLDVSLG